MASTASAPEADLDLGRPTSAQGENSHNCFVTASPSTLRSSIISYVAADPLRHLPLLLDLYCCLHYLCISLYYRIRQVLGAGISDASFGYSAGIILSSYSFGLECLAWSFSGKYREIDHKT